MFRDDDRIRLAADQLSCDLEGEAAILNLKDGVYYGLNAVGTRIWTLLKERPQTLRELRQSILDEYDVRYEECDRDIQALLDELKRRGLVETGE